MVGLGTERPEGAGNKDMSALNTPYNGVTLRHGPSPGRDVLYQVVVQCTERSNRAISKLNQFQEQRHNDPTYFGLVSEDEAEEPALVNPELLDWRPTQEGMTSISAVTRLIPTVMPEPCHMEPWLQVLKEFLLILPS